MIFPLVAALGSAWLLGVLAVSACWSRARPAPADLGLILPLGMGLGLGLTSAIFFAASLVSGHPLAVGSALEALAATGLAWWLGRKPAAETGPTTATGGVLVAVVASVFLQAGLVAAVVSARAYLAEPMGSWDGWAIWNMHARFIFRGGVAWSDALRLPQIGWTHPDYPLLVPASVARAWAWLGRDAPLAPALVSAAFGAATVGLLVAAVARLRHRLVALAGGLVLLGTPFFVTFSSNEHADIPLGFFILATLALLALGHTGQEKPGRIVLAGFSAGLAAWTKNEGLLFVVVITLAWCGHEIFRGSRRMAGVFLGGLVVALLPVVYFKVMLAPPGDIMSGQLGSRFGQLGDGARHRLILAALWRDTPHFGEWSIAPFLAMMLPLLGPGWRRLNGREWLIAGAILLMLAGYYAIYLLTPMDLRWHLDYSLVRLLLQLWPAAILFWCLAVSVDAPPPAGAWTPRRRLTFVLFNTATAVVLLALFARQLAPNELARARTGAGEVRAVLGEGWFGRERNGAHTWVWSPGSSQLLLRADGGKAAAPVAVEFGLRSLETRTVTVSLGERIVWSGQVGTALTQVRIPGLPLSSGTMTLAFTTDRPGVPEAAGPGARALAFALYNPRIE